VANPLVRLQAALAGRYTIERELGRGGMATVYLAQDLKHHRQVAIKVLKPELAAALGPERFLREIEIAAGLNHPHILPLHDSGEADGFLYYVMPFVEGESLRSWLDREKQLPLEDALEIAREVADALSYAHGHAVVHRDIKPENILLEASHAVVSDFGIARAITAAGGEKLTPTGVTVGTSAYMSPEQAAGSTHLDGRSDLYSLGCVLYEMLAGEPPFTGPTAESIIHQHLAAPPPRVTAMRSAVPPSVERAIERALAKAPADRFATTWQFAEALGVSVAPTPRRLARARVLFALSAAIVAVAGAALFEQGKHGLTVDPNLVAVAPFDVLDRKFELWREGLVDYLSRNLDGAGPLRTVSPTIVLRRSRGRADPASASELGRRVGARLVVFGQLVGVGSDSVRLRLTVLDAPTGRALAELERTGLADRIDRLADSLTTDMLRHVGQLGADVPLRLSSVGTKSLPALKAFLQGEQLLRRFSLDSAIKAYEEAVRSDSTFALALRHMALAGAWRGQSGGLLDLKAGRLNHGLAPRDSLLITSDSLEAASDDSLDPAYWSHRVRKFAVLEGASRRYPEDPEVWYSLGEARFHYGYVVGSTAQHALDAFNRGIALDTAFAPAYFHPVQLALDRNDTALAKRYVHAYLGLTSQVPEGAGIRLVARWLDSAPLTSPDFQHLLDTTSANALFDAWRAVQRWPDASEVGVQLLRLLAKGRRRLGTSADTVWTRYLLISELLYRGHLREASAMVGSRLSVPFVELAMLGVVRPDSAAATFDRWLRSPNEQMAVGDPPLVNRCYRAFLVAGWWARNQDTVSLLRLMRRGDSVARTARSPAGLVNARGDASLARAALALARRDTTEALRQFLAFPDSLCPSFGALQLDPLRMVRFRLLVATGRYRNAALLFDQQVSPPLTASSVLATLERGRIGERLGDRAIAIQAYQFVTAVWRNSDPELRSYVSEARAGLNRLSSGPR
jgi:serine/threonine-protein kinase